MRRAGTSLALLTAMALVAVAAAPGTGSRQSDDAATFTLATTPAPKVVNSHAPELTIDPVHRVAVEDHCCDGGKWKVEYRWTIPDSFTSGKPAKITLSMRVLDSGPSPNNYAMSAMALDFNDRLDVHSDRGPVALTSKTFTWNTGAYLNTYPETGITINFVSSSVTYTYKRDAGEAARFKVDTHANDVRVGPPLVGWWQLCLSRLNGSGIINPDGGLASGGKLFQFNRCPKVRGGPRSLDASVMWQVTKGKLSKTKATLNFGTHAEFDVKKLVLTAKVVSTFDEKLCPVGTVARITLVEDDRRIANGFQLDRAEVRPAHKCLGQVQGWSNEDNPNNDPPRGGLGGGQHAQVNIDQ